MNHVKKLALLLLVVAAPQAHALEAGVLGGLNFWNGSFSLVNPPGGASVSSASSGQWAAGAFVKTGLNVLFDLEVDAIYMKKKTVTTVTGSLPTTLETASFLIPVMVRTGFIPGDFVNVGAGAYYEIGTSGGVTTDGVNGTYANAGIKHNDIGLIGSVQLKLPLAPLTHIFVDGRYLHGLSEQSLDPTISSIKNRYFQAYAGLSIGI